MLRVCPLIVVVALVACSRDSAASDAGSPASAAALDLQAAPAPRPVPAQLPEVVARVNGEAITRADFEEALQNLEARAGGTVPADQRDRIFRGLLDQLIGYKLLVQEARARHIEVPDAEIDARIAQIRGQFPSEELFTQALAARKLTLEQIRRDAREDLAIAKLIETELAGKLTVTAEQVTEFYTKNPDQFQQPERVRASHILVGVPQNADAPAKALARAKAEAILADLKAGRDFATLAREHSDDPGSAPNGGDLGFFQRGQMVGPFSDAAFALEPGATSGIIETQFGYHIIKVVEKQPARTVPLDDVRAQVHEYLENLNREQQTSAYVAGLRTKGKVEIFI